MIYKLKYIDATSYISTITCLDVATYGLVLISQEKSQVMISLAKYGSHNNCYAGIPV